MQIPQPSIDYISYEDVTSKDILERGTWDTHLWTISWHWVLRFMSVKIFWSVGLKQFPCQIPTSKRPLKIIASTRSI